MNPDQMNLPGVDRTDYKLSKKQKRLKKKTLDGVSTQEEELEEQKKQKKVQDESGDITDAFSREKTRKLFDEED